MKDKIKVNPNEINPNTGLPKESIINKYIEHLSADGKSKKTITSYMIDILAFIDWLENKDIEFNGDLKRIYITTYKEYLTKEKYKINTLNKKINSLNSFNEFLINIGATKDKIVNPRKDKIKIAKGSEGEVDIFTDEEIEKILFNIENKKNLRDKLIINLLLYTGIRVSEIVNIKIQDMDFLTMTIKIKGKGGKIREVPLKAELIDLIKEYLKGERRIHKYTNSEYLLLSQRANKLDKDTVNKVLNKLGKELNLKIYPHKFRHTFCSILIKKNVPVTTVAKLAGHSNIQTTMDYYINTSREEKLQAVNLL